nr:PREDICTED: neuropeptide CCHamide-1 receptor-like [Bemisia tabaci]
MACDAEFDTSCVSMLNETLSGGGGGAHGGNVTDARPNILLEKWVVSIVFTVIYVLGVVGNGTLLLILARHKNMRNVPNIFILSLAVGDLLVILICVPFTSVVYITDYWSFGESVCKLLETSKDISIGVSIFTLIALSADRFFAIANPMRKLNSSMNGRRATRCTLLIVVFIWLMAAVFALPAATLSFLDEKTNPNRTKIVLVCYPYPRDTIFGESYPKMMVLFKFLIYYAIPLSIIACFYTSMARHLLISTRNMPGEISGQVRQIRARKKVAKTVLAFVVLFAICFFPQHVFMLWFYFYPDAPMHYDDVAHYSRVVAFCLSFLNSCINPVALYCVSGTFRKYYDRYLFCCCRRGRYVSHGSKKNSQYTFKKRQSESALLPTQIYTSCRNDPIVETTLSTIVINGIDSKPQHV